MGVDGRHRDELGVAPVTLAAEVLGDLGAQRTTRVADARVNENAGTDPGRVDVAADRSDDTGDRGTLNPREPISALVQA